MSYDVPVVLISAYACGPNFGSEIGMGWNWVRSLADLCELTVITESEFQRDITTALRADPPRFAPTFHFIDIGQKARRRCWNQGDWRFYLDYRRWQARALFLARTLCSQQSFDLTHQLNMIGYREPGYLWELDLPFLWGPIGGHAQAPYSFLSTLGLRGGVQNVARNVLNFFQMRTSWRVKRAMRRARLLLAATSEDQLAIYQHHKKKAFLLNETGADLKNRTGRIRTWDGRRPLRVVWCGKFVPRKSLPIALHAISRVSQRRSLRFEIIGSGPEEIPWKALATRLAIGSLCEWRGQLSHEETLSRLSEADVLLFTSFQEGTPHVVLEALSLGVPVICHNCCGQGDVVDDRCGLKIELRNPQHSVTHFAQALLRLQSNPNELSRLSEGALSRASELHWKKKALTMLELYRSVMDSTVEKSLANYR